MTLVGTTKRNFLGYYVTTTWSYSMAQAVRKICEKHAKQVLEICVGV